MMHGVQAYTILVSHMVYKLVTLGQPTTSWLTANVLL